MKQSVFTLNDEYTLPPGHNPLPAGWRGRLVALKWLLTGRRPSVEGYVIPAKQVTVSCIGVAGNGGGNGGWADRKYKCFNGVCQKPALFGKIFCKECLEKMQIKHRV